MRRTSLILVLMAATVSVSLFVVKHEVQDLDDRMHALDRDIVRTKEAIHVLKAEWAHLNQPDRLRRLAGAHLELGPLDAEQIGAADPLLTGLPEREETQPDGEKPHD